MKRDQEIRQKLLEIICLFEEPEEENSRETGPLLRRVSNDLNLGSDLEAIETLLDIYYGLFRSGHLQWGSPGRSFEPPRYHVTKIGRTALQNFSQDPVNQEGYIQHVKSSANLNPIAESYLREAVKTFNMDCSKAAAVMVGGASGSIILELRDALSSKLKSQGSKVPRDLNNWRIKRLLDAIEKELEKRKLNMPRKLKETFDSFWSAFTEQLRMVRNDAGHPKSVDPITTETVHSTLLIFPVLSKLADEIKQWINSSGFQAGDKHEQRNGSENG